MISPSTPTMQFEARRSHTSAFSSWFPISDRAFLYFHQVIFLSYKIFFIYPLMISDFG
jgi:hypothetical protein